MKKIISLFVTMSFFYGHIYNINAQYCTSGGPTSTSDSNIEQVDITGESATSISFTGCPGVTGVQDLTVQSVDLIAGNSYNLDVTFGTCGGNYNGAGEIFIDWNQDFTFDVSESIGQSNGMVGTAPWDALVQFNFTVPANAGNGTTVMRIIQIEGGSNPLDPCESFSYGSVMDFSINISGGIDICSSPIGFTVTNITTNSADILWSQGGSEISWNVEIGNPGFIPGTSTELFSINNTLSTTWSVSGLSAGTNYEYYVQSYCGVGDTSYWNGPSIFSTQCVLPTAITLPFIEDFESINGTIQNSGNIHCASTYSWSFETEDPTGRARWGTDAYLSYNGNGAITLDRSPSGTDVTTNAILTIDLSAYASSTYLELSFAWASHGDEESLGDRIRIRGSNTDAWLIIYDLNPENLTDNTYELVRGLDIDELISNNSQTITSTFQIDFGQEDNFPTSSDGISFDDIKIEIIPCPSPTNLMASNILTTSADLEWTAGDSETMWDVEVGLLGFTPGTGNEVISESSTSANTWNVSSGLEPSTEYEFYVKALCGNNNESIWEGPIEFRTECYYVAPYSESFDRDQTPSCMTQYATSGGPWVFGQLGSADYAAANAEEHTGNGGYYAWVDFSGTDIGVSLELFDVDVSALTIPYLSFYLYSANTYNTDSNYIFIESYDGMAWQIVDSIWDNYESWKKHGFDLTSHIYNTDYVRVRFRAESGGSASDYYNDMLIDDILIDELPPPTLTWDETVFIEDLPNDGSSKTIINLVLTEETFATVDDTLVLNTDYTVANLPTGLTVEIIILDENNATITLTGNAASHSNANDVNNFTITFEDAAFTGGNAANVVNYSQTTLNIDFNDPASPILIWDKTSFNESIADNGSIAGAINLTLSNETFTPIAGGFFTPTTDFTVANLPTGLMVNIQAIDASHARISITGFATSHTDADDISNLEISFEDGAFTGGDASIVINSSQTSISIDFDPIPEIIWNATTFVESTANNGSISTIINLELTVESFATIGTLTSGFEYSVTNVPAGLSVLIVTSDANNATISLIGYATYHLNGHDVTDMNITFYDAAFAGGTPAINITNYSQDALVVNFFSTLSISSFEEKMKLSIYPNPSYGSFIVNLTNSERSNVSIQLFNLQGQVIENRVVYNSTTINERFDVSSIAKGLYFVKVSSGSNHLIEKIIIQ